MKLLRLEQKYSRAFGKQYSSLTKLYSEAKSCSVSLRKSDVTHAIILRMKTYYEVNNHIATFLNKKSVTPAAGFFVETVVFYLKLFLEKKRKDWEVHSERKLKPERGAIKPDISIWQGDKVLAIIECKTNLGWNRTSWGKDFKEREKKLRAIFPEAKAFLLVLTSINWPGFDAKDKRVGKQLFVLSSEGMRKIRNKPIDNVIENRIEGLFREILSLS